LVEWAPEVKPTPFMEWLAKDGVLFGYGHLSPGESADFHYFYSCNLSLKTAFVRENGMFNEDFKGYGFEDTELGYRLQNQGLRLLYNPAAVGYHHKFISFADACLRAKVLAAARKFFEAKEAGMVFARMGAQKKGGLAGRLKRLCVRTLVPFLWPIKPLLNSHLRLPRILYRASYSYYAVYPAAPQAGVEEDSAGE
jgi:GT2 family glycosyltransferase